MEWHSAFICEVQGYAGQAYARARDGEDTIHPSAPFSDDLEFKYFLFVESDQVEDMLSSEDLPDNRTCASASLTSRAAAWARRILTAR